MWSLYVGRPWGISIRDISISRPLRELGFLKRKVWYPYNSPSNLTKAVTEVRLDPLETCTDANITLCVLMGQINRTL